MQTFKQFVRDGDKEETTYVIKLPKKSSDKGEKDNKKE